MSKLLPPTKWECYHGCGRTISDDFYRQMIKAAGHPPRCVCMTSLYGNGVFSQPWSLWKKITKHGEKE